MRRETLRPSRRPLPGDGLAPAALAAGGLAALLTVGGRVTSALARREAERDEARAVREALVEAMVDRFRDREAAEVVRREWVAGVSHDVRTPLTSLRLLATAIRDEVVGRAELADHAETMLLQLDLLSRLTEQVFELARLEAGDLRWTLVTTQVGDLIRDAAGHLRADAGQRRVALAIDVPEGLPPAPVAPDRILRVVVNLVQNALEHTPPGGCVRVWVRRVDGCLATEVRDTGSGIAPELRDHVFEPFFRGDRTGAAGSGFGLAISRAIVEAHGGRIGLVDTPVGTRVRFTLPIDGADGARAAHPGQPAVAPSRR